MLALEMPKDYLPAMGFYVTEPYQMEADPLPENCVWGFRDPSAFHARRFPAQAVEPHQEAVPLDSSTVSGVGEWLSNDPIGISGGLNQYVAFGNNPVNFRDWNGTDICHADGNNTHSSLIIDAPDTGTRYMFDFRAKDYNDNPFDSRYAFGLGITFWGVEGQASLDKWTKPVPNGYLRIPTSSEKDRAALARARELFAAPPKYSVKRYNCSNASIDVLRHAGVHGIDNDIWVDPAHVTEQVKYSIENYSLPGRTGKNPKCGQ
jgi:hypothetical protein